ncbi:MAG: alpha/beta hydrolase [Acholeplasmataceae bacterium]
MKKILLLPILGILIFLSGCSTFGTNTGSIFNQSIGDTDYKIQTHVYKQSYGEDIELDIVYPFDSSFDSYPVLVYVHGGAYKGGDKSFGFEKGFFWYLNQMFLEAGYAVVSVNYTLANQDKGTTMEDCFIDTKDAIRWLHKNSSTLGIDASNIGLFGSSAGGGIVTMLGYTENEDFIGDQELSLYNSNVSFVINMYGGDTRDYLSLLEGYSTIDEVPNDLLVELYKEGYKIGITEDNSLQEIIERMNDFNSLSYLDESDTPTITFHGTEDTTVNIQSSIMLHEKLEMLNIENQIFRIEGMGHSFLSGALTDSERIEYAQFAFDFGTGYYTRE